MTELYTNIQYQTTPQITIKLVFYLLEWVEFQQLHLISVTTTFDISLIAPITLNLTMQKLILRHEDL